MELKKKVPEVRFKGFSGEWTLSELGEIAEFNPKADLPDTFKYVDLESVVGTEMISHKQIGKITAPSRAQRLARKGDLFYQTVRPYQKNNYLFVKPSNDYVFSTGYAQMRPHGNGYFLLSLVQNNWFFKDVLDNCTGTSYPAINSAKLAEIKVSTPYNPEQSRIGTWFQHLDQLITLHQKKYNKLTNIKKAMLEKMFPKNGADVPEIRFEGFEGKWEENRLVDMVELIGTGKSVFTPFPEKSEHKPYAILGSRAVIGYDSEYDYSGSFILTARVGENAGKLYKYTGDVKITDNTVYIKGQNLEFIFYLLTSFSLEKLSFGTGQPLIKSSEFMNLKLMFSSEKKEQYLIGTYFQKLDQLITLQQTQIEKLQNIKKACLEKMFV